jgi:leader peptidase (prepilin peptidase)/N-methyltransferase
MGADMQLRAGPGALLTVVAFALAGGLIGIGIRMLLSRLRRGARVRPGGCESVLAMLWCTAGAGWVSGLVPGNRVPLLLGVGWLAVAAGSVDLLHRRLPDALTVPAVPIGLLLLVPLGPAAVGRGFAGAALGFVVYAVVHVLAPADLGAGDVKLAGSLGGVLAGLSWSAMAVAAVVAALLSAASAPAASLRHPSMGFTTARAPPDPPEHRVRSTVPHGPSMLAATWLVVWLAS